MEILDRLKGIITESENPIILEFGACDGYHSTLMLNMLKESGKSFKYHLFEPNNDLLQPVLNRVQPYLTENPNVKLFKEAIGASDGKMTFYKSGGQKVVNGQVTERYYGSSSIRKPKLVIEAWKEMTFNESQCDVVCLDTHVKREGIENEVIDFIWADIQGAEVDLINGGKEAFKKVKYLYTEYTDSELYEGEISLKEICALLPDFEIVEDYGGDVLLKNKNI